MTVRLNAHSPTCATGTGHCKSDSHNGKGFIIASEDSVFVPVFAISLPKALILPEPCSESQERLVFQGTGLAMVLLVPRKTDRQTGMLFLFTGAWGKLSHSSSLPTLGDIHIQDLLMKMYFSFYLSIPQKHRIAGEPVLAVYQS